MSQEEFDNAIRIVWNYIMSEKYEDAFNYLQSLDYEDYFEIDEELFFMDHDLWVDYHMEIAHQGLVDGELPF